MTELYLGDLEIGYVFGGSNRIRVTVDDIVRFATEYDPQPFHLNDAGVGRDDTYVQALWLIARGTGSYRSDSRAVGARTTGDQPQRFDSAL